jgi:hypothetical protein
MTLDGRALIGNGGAQWIERGVALRPTRRDRIETCVVVDHVGALIRCEAEAIEPLPRAVADLRTFFSGVWRDASAHEYLLCLRLRRELQVESFVWRRRLRRAVLAARQASNGNEAAR